MRPPAVTSPLSGRGPWPTHFASEAVRGRAVLDAAELDSGAVDVVVVVDAALLPPPEHAATSSSPAIPAARRRSRNLPNGFLDLAGLDARRAHVDALG